MFIYISTAAMNGKYFIFELKILYKVS